MIDSTAAAGHARWGSLRRPLSSPDALSSLMRGPVAQQRASPHRTATAGLMFAQTTDSPFQPASTKRPLTAASRRGRPPLASIPIHTTALQREQPFTARGENETGGGTEEGSVRGQGVGQCRHEIGTGRLEYARGGCCIGDEQVEERADTARQALVSDPAHEGGVHPTSRPLRPRLAVRRRDSLLVVLEVHVV